MFEIVKSGGLLMIPILGCSVVAAAIIIERLWTLQQKRVLPDNLSRTVWKWVDKKQLNEKNIKALDESSPLGAILAAGLMNRDRDRVVMKERI
ncbi:MAG: MotA/TolQ/ExbB proton channel family protein, partial [Proteobacteria bacterium]|nr:MotA/TolQ/ExbB proton channel family protein [Pseudomonadota bacterium]